MRSDRGVAAACGCALALSVVLSIARDASPKPPPRAAPAKPPSPPLPSLPTIARVRVEVARDRVVVIEDVHLPRGDWERGDLDLYVSFGAPGVPRAFDARLLPLAKGLLAAPPDAAGEPIATEHATHRPLSAQTLIGRPMMAGAILHVTESAFRAALAPGDVAVVRVRSLLDLPADDPRAGRELVVRLGVPGDAPRTLGRVELASLEPRPFVTRASAELCGPDADRHPLTVAVTPPLDNTPGDTINPRMALRHESDDLCVRFWTK